MRKARAASCALTLVCLILAGCAGSPQARRDRYLARGKQFLDKGDTARALLEFKNAARMANSDAEVYYQMGVAYLQEQDLRSAVGSFQKAVSLNPKHAGAQLRLAELMAATSNRSLLTDAQSRLRKILENESPSAQILNTLALTEMKLGQAESATRTLEQAMEQFPNQLSSAVMLARAKWELKDLKGAEEAMKKAVAEVPKSAAAHRILGEFYLTQNRLAEGRAKLQQALYFDPKDGQSLAVLAQIDLTEGKAEDAERAFRRLSALPGYEPAYALFLFRAGRRDEALREFEKLAAAHPDDRQIRGYLLATYHTMNRSADIDRVLAAALQKNPKDAEAQLRRAEILIERGKYGAAETDLNAVQRLNPTAAEVHYLRARLYRLRGAIRSYRQELTESLRLAPTALPVRLELAFSLMDGQDGKAALDVLDGALNSQKASVPFLVARNWALWTKGDLAAMRKGIDEGLAQDRNPDLLIQDGFWKLRSGNPAAALAPIEEALKAVPGNVFALQALDSVYVAQKNPALGAQKVKENAARAPQSAAVQIFLGQVLLQSGDSKQARSALMAAKAVAPESIEADLSLSQVDYQEQKYDEGKARLQAVLAADPNNETARLWLGVIEQTQGNQKVAIDQLRKALGDNPDDTQAANNLAYLLGETGSNLDEALKYAQRAVELAPDRPAYMDTLGWILYRKGLYPSAIKYMEQASLHAENAVWKYHLAMAYAKAGDQPHSQASLAAALKLNPNLPEAKAARDLVGSH